MVRDGAMLPRVCLVTGVPSAPGWAESEWMKLTFTPRWIWWGSEVIDVLLLLSPLGYALITHHSISSLEALWIWPAWFLIAWGVGRTSKNLAVLCSLSPAVVRENGRRGWIQGAFFVLFYAALDFLGGARRHPGGGELWSSNSGFYAAMGISQLIGLLVQAWAIRPIAAGHQDGWFRIRNCHPAFLNLLPAEMPPPATARRRAAPPVVQRPPPPARRGPPGH
jgi:hypothetical protein